VPGLGELFSSTNNTAGKTELVVFIRPVVVRNGEDARTVAEEFKSRLRTVGVRSAPVVKR
jgi:general secretion pathway protein D